MQTDCRSCCKGENATRTEPSWATKRWLWASSTCLRYGTLILSSLGHGFQSPSFSFHFQLVHFSEMNPFFFLFELVIAFCCSVTVTDVAISVFYSCLSCQTQSLKCNCVIRHDSCSTHAHCEIMCHLELASYALFSKLCL